MTGAGKERLDVKRRKGHGREGKAGFLKEGRDRLGSKRMDMKGIGRDRVG